MKLFITQQPMKLEKKINTDLESLKIQEKFNVGSKKLRS